MAWQIQRVQPIYTDVMSQQVHVTLTIFPAVRMGLSC